jgi:hypothetical protein
VFHYKRLKQQRGVRNQVFEEEKEEYERIDPERPRD